MPPRWQRKRSGKEEQDVSEKMTAVEAAHRMREALRSLYKWAERVPGFDATEWSDVRAALLPAGEKTTQERDDGHP